MSQLTVKKHSSSAKDPALAIAEVARAIEQPGASIVILYISSTHDLRALERALEGVFSCPVIGCTTSGEITSCGGYVEGSILGVSLRSDGLVAHPKLITPLQGFGADEGRRLAHALRSELSLFSDLDPGRMFSLLLVDGLSMLEEQVVATLHNSLLGVPLIGGSAGDDLAFSETHVYFGGRFHKNAAVLTLFETTLPFKAFHLQHFEPTATRLVITESDCATRTVTEINGFPAAEEYARAVGLSATELSPQIFAAHPVMLRVGGEYFVRSIQKVNPDGSLTFFCAIDNGLVLTVGRGNELVDNLRRNLASFQDGLPSLKVILGFDCILRRLELQQKGVTTEARSALGAVDFVGFSTYGEQFNGIHVNQTLTGIAIGEGA